jgi:hypothetical protein
VVVAAALLRFVTLLATRMPSHRFPLASAWFYTIEGLALATAAASESACARELCPWAPTLPRAWAQGSSAPWHRRRRNHGHGGAPPPATAAACGLAPTTTAATSESVSEVTGSEREPARGPRLGSGKTRRRSVLPKP